MLGEYCCMAIKSLLEALSPVLHPSGNALILKNRDSFETLEPHRIP